MSITSWKTAQGALARPAPDTPEEVATVENMTMRLIDVALTMPISGQLALPCATPATDLRTSDVRSDVRFGTAQGAAAQARGADSLGADFWQKRVRVTAPTTGMGHVRTAQILLGAGAVPGSSTWSPPI